MAITEELRHIICLGDHDSTLREKVYFCMSLSCLLSPLLVLDLVDNYVMKKNNYGVVQFTMFN